MDQGRRGERAQCMQYAMQNLHPEPSVYRAPFKGSRIHSYGRAYMRREVKEEEEEEDGDFVRSRFKLHRYYMSKANARACFPLAQRAFGIVHLHTGETESRSIDYRASSLASLNAARVAHPANPTQTTIVALTQRISRCAHKYAIIHFNFARAAAVRINVQLY